MGHELKFIGVPVQGTKIFFEHQKKLGNVWLIGLFEVFD
jgi:hypothetical protein